MTISTTTTRVAYDGNGATTAFAVPFPFFAVSELEVIERAIATGVETTLTLGVHYTVAGGDGATGTVTATSAPAAGAQWVIRRKTVRTQATDYTPNDPFPAETHEKALDRLTMIAQELSETADRALKFPKTDSAALSSTVPPSVDRAGKLLAFDAGGNPTVQGGAGLASVDFTGTPAKSPPAGADLWLIYDSVATSLKSISVASLAGYLASLAQTLTNKVIDGATNTLTVRAANDITGQLPIANGGTGAATATAARASLGVAIGSNVQAWAGNLDTWATKAPPAGTPVGTTDSQALTNKSVQFQSGATALNYYEEGTWTPSLRFNGATTGITYGAQAGFYTRVGNVVRANFDFTLTNKGTATGPADLGGLPYPASGFHYGIIEFSTGGASVPAFVYGLVSGSAILLRSQGATAASALADVNFTNTTRTLGTVIYRV